jgi:putative RecB family exonuclease
VSDVTPQDEDRPQTRPHTSFSQLDQYRRCSLAYYFKYVEGKRGPMNLNLARGKAGHTAVEANYRPKIKTGKDIPLPQLLDVFSDAFDAQTSEIAAEDILPGENLGTSKDETIETLRVFHKKVAPAVTPLIVEFPFDLNIPATEDWEYPIKIVNGRIDLVAMDSIDDFKFPASRRAKSQPEVDMSWQLTLYDQAFHQTTGMWSRGLGFASFVPPSSREPADVKIIRRSPAELEPAQRQRRIDRLIHSLRTTQKAIDHGIFIPADNPMVCARCDFRKTCQSSLAKDDFAAIAIREKGSQ